MFPLYLKNNIFHVLVPPRKGKTQLRHGVLDYLFLIGKLLSGETHAHLSLKNSLTSLTRSQPLYPGPLDPKRVTTQTSHESGDLQPQTDCVVNVILLMKAYK